ncbi:unnamed protein product [Dicrocoelium dendriticum]|nr:unnamed protein product [Dicrocoelium dendriticum]
MAHSTSTNCGPYDGYIPASQLPHRNQKNMFYVTDSRCKRYFCAVCGDCHPVQNDCAQRVTEWLTGTTLPDALHRSLEASIVDNYTYMRFKEARRVDDNPCSVLYEESERRKRAAKALTEC